MILALNSIGGEPDSATVVGGSAQEGWPEDGFAVGFFVCGGVGLLV